MKYADFTRLSVTTKDRIATITLERPETLNAVDAQLHTELRHVFRLVADDPELRNRQYLLVTYLSIDPCGNPSRARNAVEEAVLGIRRTLNACDRVRERGVQRIYREGYSLLILVRHLRSAQYRRNYASRSCIRHATLGRHPQ